MRVHYIIMMSLQERLDADDTPLVDKYGKRMARDIVQFVPLREFVSRKGGEFSLVRRHFNLSRYNLYSLG